MNNQSSGGLGLLCLIGVVILFFAVHHLFPSLTTVFLVIIGVVLLLVALLVVLVIFFAFRKPKGASAKPVDGDAETILAKGRSNLVELRQLTMRLKDQQVRNLSEDVCGIIDKILKALKEQPEDIPTVRQFFNYYLPALGGILLSFLRLEKSGVPAVDTTEKVIACLSDIRVAMEKQYTNLFDNDKLDLTVEMEVLRQMCKQDGLLTEDAIQLQDGNRNISLTL